MMMVVLRVSYLLDITKLWVSDERKIYHERNFLIDFKVKLYLRTFSLVFLVWIVFDMIGRNQFFFFFFNVHRLYVCVSVPPSRKKFNIVISLIFSTLKRKKSREQRSKSVVSSFFFSLSTVKQKLNGRWTLPNVIRWQTSQTSNHWTKTTFVYLNMIIMWLYVIRKKLLNTIYIYRSTKNQWLIQTTRILWQIKRLFSKCIPMMIQIRVLMILTGIIYLLKEFSWSIDCLEWFGFKL
jgi:hypothetical protein